VPTNGPKPPGPPLKVMVLVKVRLWVALPNDVAHGELAGEPIVPAPGPLFPAEIATNTPAPRASRNARELVSVQGFDGPAADGIVDGVYAVEHCLVDGGVGGRVRAAARQTRPVGDDVGVGRHTEIEG